LGSHTNTLAEHLPSDYMTLLLTTCFAMRNTMHVLGQTFFRRSLASLRVTFPKLWKIVNPEDGIDLRGRCRVSRRAVWRALGTSTYEKTWRTRTAATHGKRRPTRRRGGRDGRHARK
jgi:hypothetical protein